MNIIRRNNAPVFYVVMCILIVFTSGCMSYRTGQIPDVILTKQDFASGSKPTVYLDVKCQTQSFNETALSKSVVATQKFRGIVAGVLEETDPFKSYTFTESRNKNTDIRLFLSLQSTEEGSIANLLLTAGTLTIIPGTSSIKYHLVVQAFDSTGKERGTYEIEDSMRVWVQILFLPIGSWKNPTKVEKQLLENLVRTTLARIKSDGLLNVPQ